MADELEPNPKISRRTAIRRGAVIGAGVWAVPTISSMRLPAHAQVGSPMPEPTPPDPNRDDDSDADADRNHDVAPRAEPRRQSAV